MKVTLRGETLELLAQKALYWEDEQTLVVSDLHLGKAGHFRKNGIPVPATIHYGDLDLLTHIFSFFPVEKVIFLGDLFHSEHNLEWTDFLQWLNLYKEIRFVLVKGNHDVLPDRHYLQRNLQVVDRLDVGPFTFTHEPSETGRYNLAGHVHPCVRLQGVGKQGLSLPCFFFGAVAGILPAFGNFTGSHTVRPRIGDRVFGVLNDTVVDLVGEKPLNQSEN